MTTNISTSPSNASSRLWQKPLSPIVKIAIAILGLLIILVMMTVNIKKYESHLAMGDTVLLELAPVDPRGLMQGDYMTLHFALADDITEALRDLQKEDKKRVHNYWHNSDGIAIVNIDDNNVAHFERLMPFESVNSFDKAELTSDEMALHFRVRHGEVKFATNAFFFQEGHAKDYEAAEYGLFRVNQQGEPLLTHMVNGKFEVIEGGMVKNSQRILGQ